MKQNGPISPDSPAYTSGGNLACLYVIHVVGPVWGEGEEDKKLSLAVQGALKMVDQTLLPNKLEYLQLFEPEF